MDFETMLETCRVAARHYQRADENNRLAQEILQRLRHGGSTETRSKIERAAAPYLSLACGYEAAADALLSAVTVASSPELADALMEQVLEQP